MPRVPITIPSQPKVSAHETIDCGMSPNRTRLVKVTPALFALSIDGLKMSSPCFRCSSLAFSSGK